MRVTVTSYEGNVGTPAAGVVSTGIVETDLRGDAIPRNVLKLLYDDSSIQTVIVHRAHSSVSYERES